MKYPKLELQNSFLDNVDKIDDLLEIKKSWVKMPIRYGVYSNLENIADLR